jgi:hypothetical protein
MSRHLFHQLNQHQICYEKGANAWNCHECMKFMGRQKNKSLKIWIAFLGRVTYSNQNFLTFQQMLQLPFSELVNLGITVVPLCSFGSRQCAGQGLTGILPHIAHYQKMASAAVPQIPRNLYWTRWPNPKRRSSAMNNGCKNLNIRNTENKHWKCKDG